jgi:hypothetical protein
VQSKSETEKAAFFRPFVDSSWICRYPLFPAKCFSHWTNPVKTTIKAVLVLGFAAMATACADSIIQPNGHSNSPDARALSQVSPASQVSTDPALFVAALRYARQTNATLGATAV